MSGPSVKVEVKGEPLESVCRADSEGDPAPAEQEGILGHEQAEVTCEERERTEPDGGPGNTSQNASDAGERSTTTVHGLSCDRLGP